MAHREAQGKGKTSKFWARHIEARVRQGKSRLMAHDEAMYTVRSGTWRGKSMHTLIHGKAHNEA